MRCSRHRTGEALCCAGPEVLKCQAPRFERAVQISEPRPCHCRHLGVAAAVIEKMDVYDATQQVERHDSTTRVRKFTICELNSAEAVSGTDNLQLFASLRSRSDGINHLGLRRRKQTCHRATDLHAIPIRVLKTGWRIAQDTRKGAENDEEDKNASYTGS
jgi:hypothetical protein